MQIPISKIKEYHIRLQKQKYAERERERLFMYKKVSGLLQSYLKEHHKTEIYLFGSILKQGAFHSSSDIDIAVKNLVDSRLDLYARWSELMKREIDIVNLERCDFAEDIYKYGERVRIHPSDSLSTANEE